VAVYPNQSDTDAITSTVLRDCGDERIPLGKPAESTGSFRGHVEVDKWSGRCRCRAAHNGSKSRVPSALQDLSILQRIREMVGTKSIHFPREG
jgi:hypothetical protein